MIGQKTKYQRSKIQPKTEGSVLLISVLLSGLMLTVGIMSARLAVRDVQISADLFLSEKAYFSAESGVEKSLWLLKSEPLAHVEATNDVTLGDLNTEVSIRNLINTTPGDFPLEAFSFTLPPLQSQKFRFRQDTDTGVNTNEAKINPPAGEFVRVDLDSAGDFFWRFLCQDQTGTKTISLQAEENGTSGLADLTLQPGETDDGHLAGNSINFANWGTVNLPLQADSSPGPRPDKTTCYLSIQNLSTTPREFTFSGTTMAPNAAQIHSVGRHEGREKHIRFDYAQKTLGALFDFSFLHSADGL